MGSLSKVIIPLISIAALILAIYSWYLEDQRKLRIDQVVQLSKNINNRYLDSTSNVDSLRNEIIQLQFERQSYISNLDLMSNWFIFFETILFGIFFVVGYGVFDNKITDSYKKSETAQAHINERYLHFKNEFKDLKIEIYKDAIQLYDVVSYLNISNNDIRMYIEQMLISLEKANDVYELEKSDKNLSRISQILAEIWEKLDKYYEINTLAGGINHGKNELMSYQRRILDLSNIDEKGIKALGHECVLRLNGIIRKNETWCKSSIKPIDSHNQV